MDLRKFRNPLVVVALGTMFAIGMGYVLVNRSPMSKADQALCDVNKQQVTPDRWWQYETPFLHVENVTFDDRCNPTFSIVLATSKDTLDMNLAKSLLLEEVCMSFEQGKTSLPSTTDRITYVVKNIDKDDVGSVTITKADCDDVQPSGQLN